MPAPERAQPLAVQETRRRRFDIVRTMPASARLARSPDDSPAKDAII
jgi:hypothetical protein